MESDGNESDSSSSDSFVKIEETSKNDSWSVKQSIKIEPFNIDFSEAPPQKTDLQSMLEDTPILTNGSIEGWQRSLLSMQNYSGNSTTDTTNIIENGSDSSAEVTYKLLQTSFAKVDELKNLVEVQLTKKAELEKQLADEKQTAELNQENLKKYFNEKIEKYEQQLVEIQKNCDEKTEKLQNKLKEVENKLEEMKNYVELCKANEKKDGESSNDLFQSQKQHLIEENRMLREKLNEEVARRITQFDLTRSVKEENYNEIAKQLEEKTNYCTNLELEIQNLQKALEEAKSTMNILTSDAQTSKEIITVLSEDVNEGSRKLKEKDDKIEELEKILEDTLSVH